MANKTELHIATLCQSFKQGKITEREFLQLLIKVGEEWCAQQRAKQDA